ncbi:ABC transporter permease [Actinospica durhamensis]|uniref:ABC transporter permease n=1 Tax=Actinospica durhamensis TaxID=1508375 RepID=A0A941EP64_9ACTN|nr:ABC transporter permease [Actinospica durhamensis]MBR7835337.1 ABC transporter permease [Actinospica durhamensis]
MTLIEEAGVGGIPPQPEELAVAARREIEGRSLGRIAWDRLKRDKVAMAGGVLVILLILMAIFAPQLSSLEGQDPNSLNGTLIDPNYSTPIGGMGGISAHHWLGVDLPNGRDIFSRIVYGARYSLGIAGVSTLVAIVFGVVIGMIAGYFGGWIDNVLSRLMDLMLAFPVLLLSISILGVLPNTAFGLSGNSLRIALLIVVIGFFSWPYIGRIVRGQTIALREREFVDAARSLGASPFRIIFKEILPNLLAPIVVYATLLIPANILFEAALSYLGVGMREPTSSWGAMINAAIQTFQIDPEFLIVPGMAIFITVLAFNLFGDGLRDAFDPKASR